METHYLHIINYHEAKLVKYLNSGSAPSKSRDLELFLLCQTLISPYTSVHFTPTKQQKNTLYFVILHLYTLKDCMCVLYLPQMTCQSHYKFLYNSFCSTTKQKSLYAFL